MRLKKICFLMLLICSTLAGTAQTSGKFAGTWEGILNAGIELRIVFHIKEDGKGGFSSTADSPDQSAYGLKCDATTVKENEVTILMTDLNASFSGKLVNDTTIDGTFSQGAQLPLILRKKILPAKNSRPQTPLPPFPYKSEEVEYVNDDKSIHFGATITIPEGSGPHPAVLLITGSGPQDRNETIMGHKPFAVLADHLTRRGYVVLRVDDRGVGKTTGKFNGATSEDFANDVSTSLDYLLSRPEVDKNKTGLIGHSEGGMIAPMVAVKRKEVSFIILLAAPGVRIIELMAEQNAAIAKAGGASEETTKDIKPLFIHVATAIMNAQDSASAFYQASIITENWAVKKSKAVLAELDFETPASRKAYITEMVKEFNTPWFRYFMKFDPHIYLEQLQCKVLAVNGDKDIQVISSQNLPGIERSLKNSRTSHYEIKELPGLNHLFQTCTKCTLLEYGLLEETFAPAALEDISAWLKKNIK